MSKDGVCKEHFDCDVNLFCDQASKTCQTQFEFGLPCESSFQCVNNCLCNQKKCIFYFSLAEGSLSDFDQACLSGYRGNVG